MGPHKVSKDKLSQDKTSKDKEGDGADAPSRASHGFMRPTIQEIRDYCRDKGYTHVDAEYFWNYYENIGWRVGKNKMKSWKLAVSNWEKRQQEFEREKGAQTEIVQHDQSEQGTWGGILDV